MGKTNKKDILLIMVGICAFIIVITVFVDFIRVNNKVSKIREQMNEVCEKYLFCPDNIQEAYEEKILPLDIVKIKEQHGLSFDLVSYCEKDAEEAVRRIVEMDEYYIFTGYMSIVDAISKYYIFDVDGTLFYIHTVDIKDSPLQQLSMYEIIKEDIK
jgi:hypothetical protein